MTCFWNVSRIAFIKGFRLTVSHTQVLEVGSTVPALKRRIGDVAVWSNLNSDVCPIQTIEIMAIKMHLLFGGATLPQCKITNVSVIIIMIIIIRVSGGVRMLQFEKLSELCYQHTCSKTANEWNMVTASLFISEPPSLGWRQPLFLKILKVINKSIYCSILIMLSVTTTVL